MSECQEWTGSWFLFLSKLSYLDVSRQSSTKAIQCFQSEVESGTTNTTIHWHLFDHCYKPAIVLNEGTKYPHWLSLCFSRFLSILNILPQVVQLKGFSPVWNLRCAFRLSRRRKLLPHCMQVCGFCPVWNLKWRRRLFLSANVFEHVEHEYGLSPEWKRSCRRRIFLRLNVLPQMLQGYPSREWVTTFWSRHMPSPQGVKQQRRWPVCRPWWRRRSLGRGQPVLWVASWLLAIAFWSFISDSGIMSTSTSCTTQGRFSFWSGEVSFSFMWRLFFSFGVWIRSQTPTWAGVTAPSDRDGL